MLRWSRWVAAAGVLGLVVSPAAFADVTGTWKSDAPPVVIQLHQRSDGSLLGYHLSMQSFVAGTVIGSGITVAVDTGDPGESELLVLDGSFSDTTMTLDSPDGPVILDKVVSVYDEQRYLLLPMSPSGDPDATSGVDLAVANAPGGFHAGSFEARHRCDLFSCSGDVTNVTELPATDGLQLDLEWDDACPGTASIDTTWDPAESFYVGSYTVNDCQGVRGDSIVVALDRGTRTDHVASVLESLATLADDMESETSFTTAHPSIAASYLHAGADDAALRSSLDAQNAAWDSIDVVFRSIDFIGTATHPRTHPLVALGEVVTFRDERSGAAAGGGPFATFRNAYTDAVHGELKHLTDVAGTWRLVGDQTNETAGIRMPFDPGGGLSEMFGAWPFGAHGGGHPEGHPGIDFELDGSAVIVAVRSGTISEIKENWLTPDQVNIELDCGELGIHYSHVDSDLAPGISPGANVTAGQPLGWPGEYCCDPVKCCEREGCAPGEEATCCSTNYPSMGDCDPGANPDYHHLIHFGVSGIIDDECPFDVMNDGARDELETLFLASHYAEEFTEPFLCNDDERRADAMPYVTHWEKVTAVSGDNPETVVIDRGQTYGDPDYRFLDGTGTELHAGILCANNPSEPTSAEFIENGTGCFSGEPGTVSRYGTFDITGDGHEAVMTLDLGGTGTDSYTARVVDDPPPPCAPAAGAVAGLSLAKQGAGATLVFAWGALAGADDYVLFESGAPDGDFMVPVDVSTGGVSVPMPGTTRFYRVVARNATCGLDRPLP